MNIVIAGAFIFDKLYMHNIKNIINQSDVYIVSNY